MTNPSSSHSEIQLAEDRPPPRGPGNGTSLGGGGRTSAHAGGRRRQKADATQAVADVEGRIDKLSLTQALTDCEIANARSIDVTRRLIDSRRELAELQASLEQLQLAYRELRTEHEAMKSSKAFVLAQKIWTIRNAFGL